MKLEGVCTTKRVGDRVHARCRLRTAAGGHLDLDTSVAVPPIVDEMMGRLRAGDDSPMAYLEDADWEAGFGLDDIWGGIKDAAESVAKSKAVQNIAEIVNHPDVKKGIGLASTFMPGLGATYGAVSKGAELLQAAKGAEGAAKEAAAKTRIAQLAAAAKAGKPAEMHATGLLRQLYQLLQGAQGPAAAMRMPGAFPAGLINPYAQAAARIPYGPQQMAPPMPAAMWQRYMAAAPQYYNPRQRGLAQMARRYGASRGLALVPIAGWDVGGWAWNVPYRSNVAAALQRDPGKIHRHLYRQGVEELARRYGR